MAKRFRDAGLSEADIFVGGPRADKHNVVVRYRGKGGASAPKPLLLLAHLDVVEALKADWSPDLDPFVFTERDGYYYGRGTGDDKAMASIFVANLIRLKRENFVPDRDIIVALTADEEGGGSNGAAWLVNNHRELVDAAFVVNEGGGGSLRNGKPFFNAVQATEKIVANFTLTAKNRGGHSSLPRPDNAIYQLAAGLVQIRPVQFPGEAQRRHARVLREDGGDRDAGDRRRDARDRRRIRTTPPPTATISTRPALQLDAAHDLRGDDAHRRTRDERAAADGAGDRQLPDAAEHRSRATSATASSTRSPIRRSTCLAAPAMNPTQPSPLLPEFFEPVEGLTKVLFGDIPVIPIMGTGATDSRSFRARRHSVVRRVGPVRRSRRRPRARPRRADARSRASTTGRSSSTGSRRPCRRNRYWALGTRHWTELGNARIEELEI